MKALGAVAAAGLVLVVSRGPPYWPWLARLKAGLTQIRADRLSPAPLHP